MPFGSPLCLSFEISPPNGFGVFLSMPAKFQRSTVCDRAVTVGASENHGIVGRDFVEIPTRRKHRRLPVSFDPSASGYPFAGLCLVDACFHLREKVFEAASCLRDSESSREGRRRKDVGANQ